MNVVTNILNKHLGAVHNSSPLTIIQRKAMNILLKNAEKNIHADVEHKISVKEIMRGIGWSSTSKTPDNLKECLSDLVSIKIQWNIFEADRKSKWITSSLLASVAIKEGDVFYSYSHHLRALLSQPNVYAKLDLGIQKLFKVKYSMLIWEYVSGELSSKKLDNVVTKWLTYEDMLKLTYLENSIYENRYSFFLERVLDKATLEINLKSDLQVSYETLSERGKITHIRFLAHRKGKVIEIECKKVMGATDKLENMQLSNRQIQEIKKKFTDDEINNAYDFFMQTYESQESNIKNPVAFFKKALEEGWVTSNVMQHSLEKTSEQDPSSEEVEIRSKIEVSDESDSIKTIRLHLLKILGAPRYTSWFKDVRMFFDNHTLKFKAISQYNLDWIEGHYRSFIQEAAEQAFKTHNLNIEYTVENEKERDLA
jgi:hypothetical protein